MNALGIVDFLQDWSMKKRLERLFKIYVTRKDPDGLSVMAPEPYKQRFQSNLLQIFDANPVNPPPAGAAGGQFSVGSTDSDVVIVSGLHRISNNTSSTSKNSSSFIQLEEEQPSHTYNPLLTHSTVDKFNHKPLLEEDDCEYIAVHPPTDNFV